MDTENRPVLTGLIALVGVAVVIGLLGGLAVIVGVKAIGIGESSDARSSGGAAATFNLPKPTDTGSAPVTQEPEQPSESQSSSGAPAEAISLTVAQESVSPMQQIDLTGTYQSGEGAILQVQRFEDGAWSDFPVTAPVIGGTFTTYVQTSRVGPNKFRVVDTDSEAISNEVTVTVG